MRYLDIALAVLVGSTAITGVLAWSPAGGDLASQKYGAAMALYDGLLAFTGRLGMLPLATAPIPAICAAASAASTPTLTISPRIDGVGCLPLPPTGSSTVAISFRLASRQVTVVAWSGAPA